MKTLAPALTANIPLSFDFAEEKADEPIVSYVQVGARKVTYKVRTTAKVKQLVEAQGSMFESMHPPPNASRGYTTSRLVIVPDGNGGVDLVPLLALLATAKYGPWDYRKTTPIWEDMDWTNESLANVSMTDVHPITSAQPRKRSAYGVPAGTPEYYRLYRAKNAEQWKTYQKTYRERRKQVMAKERLTLQQQRMGVRPESQHTSENTHKLAHKLDDILSALNGNGDASEPD